MKLKISEVVEITRTRVVNLDMTGFEDYEELIEKAFNLGKGVVEADDEISSDNNIVLAIITQAVREQLSHEGDITEVITKAIKL
jgi:hypothetical protein